MSLLTPEGEPIRSYDDLDARLYEIETAATQLFVVIYKQIQAGIIPERGPIADNALVLRDALNPNWPNNSDWLPDECK